MVRTNSAYPRPDQSASSEAPAEPLKAPPQVAATATAQRSIGQAAVEFAISAPDNLETGELESQDVRIERLGRQRPEIFPSALAEFTFCFSLSMSQIMVEYFVAGFNLILPTLIIELQIPAAGSVWPASAFTLVVASLLLVFGRLADMYGGYPVYVAAFAWLTVWSIVAGFSQNALMMDFCRVLQGIGPAAFLPSSMMLMGRVYRPGPRKNLVFSLYGACAPLGFFVGIFFGGLAGQYNRWALYFWIGAILSFVTTVAAWLSIPSDVAEKRRQRVSMDWWGTILLVTSLTLIVFGITQNDWQNPSISVAFVIGWVIFGCAIYVEGWRADYPILPFDVFRIKYMAPVVLVLFLTYGTLGVILLYGAQYFERFMGTSPLQVVAWFTPWVMSGLFIAVAGGFVLHLVSGTGLLIFSGAGWLGAVLLLALVPQGGGYWRFIFPSMVLATIGIDITFNLTNVFISTSLSEARQGLAGALINSILYLGMAVIWGLANIIQTKTLSHGGLHSYKNVFWFAVATASVALLIMTFFIRIERAKSDLTIDEKTSRQNSVATDLSLLHRNR